METRLAEKCPECGNQNLVYDNDSGEIICSNCGFVLSELIIDRGPEWRAFSEEERASKTRTGAPTTYSVHDKGLSTGISPFDFDARGRRLSPETKSQMWRLRKWQIRSRVHLSIDRNLAEAMNELGRLSDKLNIPPSVKEKAAVIYRKAMVENLVRGRSVLATITAALYITCRLMGILRTLQEIAEASLVDKKEVARCYRILLRKLNIRVPIEDPISYISKIAGKAGISEKTQGLAIKILHQAKRKRLHGGRGRTGLAAAALYIACLENDEEKMVQKKIAEAAGVTEVTLRNRYKQMKQKLGLNLPKN